MSAAHQLLERLGLVAPLERLVDWLARPRGRRRCVVGITYPRLGGRYRCKLRHDHAGHCNVVPVGLAARLRGPR